MNNQEAKFILSAYRSNGSDAGNPLFSEALRQAELDPTLKAWLVREQAHDAAMARKLAEITPPAGLREAILTGARVSGKRRSAWQRPLWMTLGAAAAVLLVVSATLWPKRVAAESNALAEFALSDVAADRHGGHGEQVKAIQAMLADPGVRLREALAVDFKALRGSGCRTITLHGQEIFEICFNRDGNWFHLYAMREPLAALRAKTAEVSESHGEKYCCATWSDPKSGYRYAVVSGAGIEAIRHLL